MKITKTQLRQIIKEELESVITEEEPDANADPFDDELLNPDDDKGIPSISSVLAEIDLGSAYLIGEAASAILVLSYAAMKIVIGPAVSRYLADRNAKIMKDLNEEEKAEATLLVELLTDDVVFMYKLKKYLEILDIVAENKGKRSKELAKIRKAKKTLASEVNRDINRKINEYVETISGEDLRAYLDQRRRGGSGSMATRAVMTRLIMAIKAKADMPKAERPRAITTDVLDAMNAVRGEETERESDDDRERRDRARAARVLARTRAAWGAREAQRQKRRL